MDLYRILRSSIYLMVLCGAFGCALAEGNVAVFLTVAVLSGLAFYFIDSGKIKPVRQEFVGAMSLALILLFILPLHEPDGFEKNFPTAFAHFLLAFQVLLFFTSYRPGFLLGICGISTLAVVIISGVVQRDATVLLRMTCLVALTTWTFFIYSIWRTRERYQNQNLTQALSKGDASRLLPERAFRQGLAMTLTISAACLVLGFFFFFSAPRLNERIAGWLELLRGDREKDIGAPGLPGVDPPGPITGIDNNGHFKLQVAKAIEKNTGDALNVTLYQTPGKVADQHGRIYIRGMVYSEPAGNDEWRSADKIVKLTRRPEKLLEVTDPSAPEIKHSKELIRQTVQPIVTAGDISKVYFGMAPIVSLDAKEANIDDNGGLWLTEDHLPGSYDIFSQQPVYEEKLPPDSVLEYPDTSKYVETRMNVRDDKLKRWSARIVANCTTKLEKARAIASYLRENNSYTLRLDELKYSSDPLYEFLTSPDKNQRRGHCQYFASAFVVLCRLNSIPARLATGFMAQPPATPDDSDAKQFMVKFKNLHAHAWAEVYCKDIGWVIFDPTPLQAANSSDTADTNIVAAKGTQPDVPVNGDPKDNFVQRTWWKIIGFNNVEQERLYSRIGSAVGMGLKDVGSLLTGNGTGGWFTAILSWIILGAAATWLLQFFARKDGKRAFRQAAAAQRARAAVAFYNDLLQVLTRRGFMRRPGQTPREFAEYVMRRGGNSFQPVLTVTEVFESVRYGQHELTQDEFDRLQTALDQLRELAFAASVAPKRENENPKNAP